MSNGRLSKNDQVSLIMRRKKPVYLIYENTTVVIMVFCGLFFHCAFQKDMIDVVERSKFQMIIKDYTLNHKQGLQYYHQLSTIQWYCSK